MQCALAVAGKDDRRIRVAFEELVERRGNVRISEIERLLGVLVPEEERAERRLAIARRPDRPGVIESAGLALYEQQVPVIALAMTRKRCIPPIALEIGRRVDVEDRSGLSEASRRRSTCGFPVGGIVGPVEARPRQPAFHLRIVRPGPRRRGLEMSLRGGLLDQHLLAELEDRERSRDDEKDQEEDEDEEAAGAHWPGALLVAAGTGKLPAKPHKCSQSLETGFGRHRKE